MLDTACAGVGNELHVCLRKNDGRFFHAIRRPDGSWIGFNDGSGIPNAGNDNAFVACAGVGNELHVCLRKNDGRIFHALRRPDGSWWGFNDVNGGPGIQNAGNDNNLVACAGVGNELHVCLRKNDGRFFHAIRRPDGSWIGFNDGSGIPNSGGIESFASTGVGNELHVCLGKANKAFFHAIRRPDGSWIGFNDGTYLWPDPDRNWLAYHDRTSADHQAHFDRLYPTGWRMISLSVYGARGDERYAAVWVERAGPDWSAVHGINAPAYQLAFNNNVAAGYRPVLLSVTGPANDPVFAGTFERSSLPTPLTRFGLIRGSVNDSNTIDFWIDQARKNGWYPTSISLYGTTSDPYYAIMMEDNPDGICWTMEGLLDTAADYQARFDALVPAHARPVHVAVSPDGSRYASIFRDDQIPNWSAIHNWDSAGYQQVFDRLVPQGARPVMVQAGGVGAGARFAANFALDDTRLPLTWHPPTGPVAVPAIDDAVRLAMQRHRIRGASLALVRGGRLVYARGYAYAEPGYPAVEPTTYFRQASVSKTIVALAVHRLVQDGRLTLNTPVQSVLALTKPDGSSPAPSFSQVTIQHLLEHTSGLPSNPYGIEPNVVDAFNAPLPFPAFSLPVDGAMTDRYMLTLPASAPPTMPAYNNWGYFLLGHVVKAITGDATLVDALDRLLFQPLGITRIREARTRIQDQPADEVAYHPTSLFIGPSVVEADRRWRASGFGGGWNLERDDAGGGLTGSTVDVARLLAMLDVRINNPVLSASTIGSMFSLAEANARGGHGFDKAFVINASAGTYYGMKGGSLPESNQNCIRYQTGDLSMVICWNRHDIGEGSPPSDGWWYPEFPAVLDAARAQSWGTSDLFPIYGMPSF